MESDLTIAEEAFLLSSETLRYRAMNLGGCSLQRFYLQSVRARSAKFTRNRADPTLRWIRATPILARIIRTWWVVSSYHEEAAMPRDWTIDAVRNGEMGAYDVHSVSFDLLRNQLLSAFLDNHAISKIHITRRAHAIYTGSTMVEIHINYRVTSPASSERSTHGHSQLEVRDCTRPNIKIYWEV